MIIFTISLDMELEPDPILISDPDPLKQIISYLAGSGSGSTTLLYRKAIDLEQLLNTTARGFR
jgi:hypothetical protein